MILEFSTKTNTNGNRYYLAIDTDNKTFSLNSRRIYFQKDVVTVTNRDRNKILKQLSEANFKAVDYI